MRTLLIVFLLASRAACAQVARLWPCNAATGKIEFTGHLPWPDSVRTETQRQRLVRRWYRQKLTNDTPAVIRDFTRESGITYAGVPTYSCYRMGIMTSEEERFSFCFKVSLTTNDTHLTYRLTDFECTESVYDAVTGALLEDALNLADTRTQSFLELFHQQLLAGLKGWQ